MGMEKSVVFHISLCMLILSFGLSEAAPQTSAITSIPGFNASFPSKHYSGYVSVDGDPPKHLYYYFVESERNPSKDPVVLWLNGGPGCSSFDGFVYEHGPFNFEPGKQPTDLPILHLNPYSWSKVSNIIYLDSPAGVGFSYCENTTSYETGDLQTASDSHTFLLKWFEQYPEFLSNPFYIAGESYAGVYVPTLASNVAEGIKTGSKPIINLKGYMVGNGVADKRFDGNALVPFAHGMGLISDALFEEAEGSCGGNYYNPADESCELTIDKVNRVLDGLNIYNILEPCYHSPSTKDNANGSTSLPLSFKQLGETERPLAVRKRMFGRAWPFRAPVRDGLVPMWSQLMEKVSVPCMNDEVATTWLNNDAVRKAIHAKPESGAWSICTSRLLYKHDAGSMINYHRNLTTYGHRVLIFSGDHDMCVPFPGTEAWTRSLGYEIVDEWRSWESNGQVAGFTQGYANNLIFLTIKGAGHTVPEYKPREALDFYGRWLEGRRI